MPSKVYGSSITLDENSFVRKLDNDESIPSLSQLRTKINDVKVDKSYCIESIILKVPERREVQTKSGESILLSEMFVEDDTGQIWVKGWRNQARLTDKCELGEIVSITGLNAKAGLEGRIELFLTAFSKIIKKN
jgi:replication factor A1